ncbi:MAG: hypothetical protein K2O06_18125 [Acetatifactor sp.]|nr:hypothetical protein [Acetatifactor sp.]
MKGSVMEYRHRMRWTDWLRWALAIVGKTQGKGRILVLTAILGMLGVYLTKLGLEQGAFFWADSAWSLLVFPIFLCFPWVLTTVVIWWQSSRHQPSEELVLRLEEDRMILEGAGTREVLLEDLCGCECAGGLLLLKHWGIGEEVHYSLLPRRVFREPGEEEKFLKELERRVREAKERGRKETYPSGCYQYSLDEEGLAHILAVYQAADRRGRRKEARAGFFLAAGVCLIAAAALYWLLSWQGLLLFLLLGMMARLFIGGRSYSEQDFLEAVKAGKYSGMLGEWKVDLSGDLIRARVKDRQCLIGWKGLKEVLLVEDTYVFCYKSNRVSQISVPVSALAASAREQEFLDRCAEQGLKLPGEAVQIQKEKKRSGFGGRKFLRIALTTALIFLAFRSLWPRLSVNPKPVSLEEQRRILEELGFVVPGELMEEIGQWMEEEEAYREYVEKAPFYELLLGLGQPQWDQETWEVTAFPEQAYWFDWEAWDVSASYEEILRGVETLSGGELRFDQIVTDWSGADWENGTGRIKMTFTCNGKPCSMTLQVSNDWLDNSVIKKLNGILAGLPGREGDEWICACDDGGQGVILFYHDRAWAREFEKRTGLELYFR